MSNQLAVIEKKLTSPDVTNKLALALNLNPQDENAKNQAYKYASSVLAEVAKTAGDSKKDLTVCQPDSIVQAMIDAAQYQLAIDGRQLAHLVKYGTRASFMPGYRAYLYKIKQHYPDADFTIECIFEGDDVKIWAEDGTQHFTLKKNSDPFDQSIQKFKGVLFAVNYTDNGRLVQKVMAVPKERIARARKAAKQDYIWTSDFFEKAKAAAIKNACKVLFTSLQGLQDMAQADNENNYDVSRQEAAPTRKSIVDNINAELSTKPEQPDVIDIEIVDSEPQEPDVSEYIEAGAIAAAGGVESYKTWLGGLGDEIKPHIRHMHSEWTRIAKEAEAEDDFPI
jgi:recombinational DNA repair protein RecT